MSKQNIWARFETDADLESEGMWVDMGNGLSIKIRSIESDLARRTLQKLAKQNRAVFRTNDNTLPPNVQDANEVIMCRDVYVVDWKGMPTSKTDETPLPCTKKNVADVMTKLPWLREQVVELAGMRETFRPQDVEDMAGNSESTTAPTSEQAAS